jgi:hypothetical protein
MAEFGVESAKGDEKGRKKRYDEHLWFISQGQCNLPRLDLDDMAEWNTSPVEPSS